MSDSDETLVADLREGRIEAFRKLYDRHQQTVLRLAKRILGNHADAEDAVHDAFLILYEKVGGFHGRSSFTTWFYRIVVNACLQIRKKSRRIDGLDEKSGLAVGPADPGMNEAVSAMGRELNALPMRQRVVFHLAEVEGRSLKETAGILGLKAGTVRHHFFKARERLKARLRPFLDIHEENRSRRSAGSRNDES